MVAEIRATHALEHNENGEWQVFIMCICKEQAEMFKKLLVDNEKGVEFRIREL